MNPRAVFEQFRREHRGRPVAGHAMEVLPFYTRHTAQISGAKGFVVFAELPAGREDELIADEIAHFARVGQPFEWSIFDFDTPADLKARLEKLGFAAEHEEAFMVLPVEAWHRTPALPAGLRIERIADERGLRDLLAVQEAVWPDKFGWLFDYLALRLRTAPGRMSFYCAYAGEQPVATGWIDFPDTSFAHLHGGAVRPEFRGRGIFSALVDHRIREARTRGYRWVAVDAAPMSRPLLVRQGFQHVCFTYPMCRG